MGASIINGLMAKRKPSRADLPARADPPGYGTSSPENSPTVVGTSRSRVFDRHIPDELVPRDFELAPQLTDSPWTQSQLPRGILRRLTFSQHFGNLLTPAVQRRHEGSEIQAARGQVRRRNTSIFHQHFFPHGIDRCFMDE